MQDPKLNVIYRFHISRGWHLQLESIRMGLFGQQTPHVSCEGGFQKVAIFLGSYARVFWIFFLNKLKPIARSLKFGVLANLLGLAYR